MDWIREKIGFLLFFLLFVIAQFLGQGMHVGYGYRDKEGQKDHSAGGASHATIP